MPGDWRCGQDDPVCHLSWSVVDGLGRRAQDSWTRRSLYRPTTLWISDGARTWNRAEPMKAVVAQLDQDDMVVIAPYVASRVP